MNAPVHVLLRAGAATGMIEDFRALAEATAPNGLPRYRERPLLEDLARFLVRGTGGPNRDAAFYELCHLVNAVDACGQGRDRRSVFFLGPEQASPQRFAMRIDDALAKAGWRRPGFQCTDEGITIAYADGAFTVRFGRMPFLAALYEFLSGMEEFAFYGELQGIFDDLARRPADVKAVQAASNRIAGAFRQYRRRNFTPIQHEGKFDLIVGFLSGRAAPGRLVVDDAAVFDFWAEKSSAGDFRVYRTVFDTFANFLQAMDEASRAEAVTRAASIGMDRENGEVEPDDSVSSADAAGEWISPLTLLDQEPAAAIKFLKKESERKPVEFLMHYGPTAIRLPLAFLRLEAFGPIQSAITTDLQVGRGAERVKSRAACTDAESYAGIVAGFAEMLEIFKRLQKATFYVLHKAGEDLNQSTPDGDAGDSPDPVAVERLVAEAARSFRAIARKGFDEAGVTDAQRIEGFRVGATALVAAAAQIERYLAASRRIGTGGQSLEERFDADRQAFSRRFGVLYGVSP